MSNPRVNYFTHLLECPECSGPGDPMVHRVVAPSTVVVASGIVVVVVAATIARWLDPPI